MAYSYDRPGSSGLRAKLASPEFDGALSFAGEATSESDYGLVNGALDTGVRAANEVLSGLGIVVVESGAPEAPVAGASDVQKL